MEWDWWKNLFGLTNYDTNEKQQEEQKSEVEAMYNSPGARECMLAQQEARIGMAQDYKARLAEEERLQNNAIYNSPGVTEGMIALQEARNDMAQDYKAQQQEREMQRNNLMKMALQDTNRIINEEQKEALIKAFRPSMPDDEAARSFVNANYVMQDNYNSWYANSGYLNKNSYGKTVVVNAETSIVDGDLVVTPLGKGNSAPDFWSATQNFGGGLYDAGEGFLKTVSHPIDTARNIGNAVLHPIDTGEAMWKGISASFEENIINGNANTRAHFFGRAIGEVSLGAVGTKGLDKISKIVRGGEAVAETANVIKGPGKAGIVTGSLDGLTSAERTVINDLTSQGKNVEVIPRSTVPNAKTPDFSVDGVKTELKTLQNPNTNTGMKRIQEAFEQGAEKVVIDARQSGLSSTQAQEIVNRAAGKYPDKQFPGRVEIWTTEGIITN